MKWQDIYDAKPSKNSRGEDVFDIYRKGEEQPIWVDILSDSLETFMKGMMDISDRAAQEEFDALFSDQELKPKDTRPMDVTYPRLREYKSPVEIEDE